MKKEKIIWTYKSLKNETPKKFLIIQEYEIDGCGCETNGTITFGMEDEPMSSVNYCESDTGVQAVHKISMNAVKKGFVIETLFDGVNTFTADENAEIEEDEEFWKGS